MPINVSVAFSQHPDPLKAVLEACVQVKGQLDSASTDLVIIFASSEYLTPEIHPIITRTLKPKHLIGSSTDTIILSNGISHRGIAVAGINSDEMHLGISAVDGIGNQNQHHVGFNLARKSSQDLQASHRDVFINLSQGIENDGSHFIRGIKEALGGAFPVLGAISRTSVDNKRPYQCFQDQILSNSAIGLLLGGAFHLALGCKHGFKPLGKPRTVTKIDNYIIRTIDHKPAFEIYKHFLGIQADIPKEVFLKTYAAHYPLGFYLEDSRQYLLRNVIDILQDGSIVCHEGISENSEVHLMISNKDSCRNSAIDAAQLVHTSMADRHAKLILIFESWARQRILGKFAFNEIQAVRDILGHTVPIIGMSSLGEIGPFGTLQNVKNIYLHNGNILILAIG